MKVVNLKPQLKIYDTPFAVPKEAFTYKLYSYTGYYPDFDDKNLKFSGKVPMVYFDWHNGVPEGVENNEQYAIEITGSLNFSDKTFFALYARGTAWLYVDGAFYGEAKNGLFNPYDFLFGRGYFYGWRGLKNTVPDGFTIDGDVSTESCVPPDVSGQSSSYFKSRALTLSGSGSIKIKVPYGTKMLDRIRLSFYAKNDLSITLKLYDQNGTQIFTQTDNISVGDTWASQSINYIVTSYNSQISSSVEISISSSTGGSIYGLRLYAPSLEITNASVSFTLRFWKDSPDSGLALFYKDSNTEDWKTPYYFKPVSLALSTDITPQAIALVKNVRIEMNQDGRKELTFQVPVGKNGYRCSKGALVYNSITIKDYRLIDFYDNDVLKFRGIVTDISISEADKTAKIVVGDLLTLLEESVNLNYPDKLSFNYLKLNPWASTGVAVETTPPCYDAWPISFVLKDLAYRCGIPDELFDTWDILRLQRKLHYGSTAIDNPDDEYIYAIDFGENLLEWFQSNLVDPYSYLLYCDAGSIHCEPVDKKIVINVESSKTYEHFRALSGEGVVIGSLPDGPNLVKDAGFEKSLLGPFNSQYWDSWIDDTTGPWTNVIQESGFEELSLGPFTGDSYWTVEASDDAYVWIKGGTVPEGSKCAVLELMDDLQYARIKQRVSASQDDAELSFYYLLNPHTQYGWYKLKVKVEALDNTLTVLQTWNFEYQDTFGIWHFVHEPIRLPANTAYAEITLEFNNSSAGSPCYGAIQIDDVQFTVSAPSTSIDIVSESYHGKKAVRFYFPFQETGQGKVYQVVNIEPSARYVAECYGKFSNISEASLRLQVETLDGNGEVQSTHYIDGNNSTLEWQKLSVSFTSPDNAVQARISVIAGAGESQDGVYVLVDNVNLRKYLPTGESSIEISNLPPEFDLVFIKGVGLGSSDSSDDLYYEVYDDSAGGQVVLSGYVNTYYEAWVDEDGDVQYERAYYDGIDSSGVNPCVLHLSMPTSFINNEEVNKDHNYRVVITPVANKGGILDAVIAYYRYLDRPSLEIPLSHHIRLSDTKDIKDLRNDIIVIGTARRIEVPAGGNVNNPHYLYVYSRAIDVDSIYNPESDIFLGRRKPFVIADPVIDQKRVADWLAVYVLDKYTQITWGFKNRGAVPVSYYPYIAIRLTNTAVGDKQAWAKRVTENYSLGSDTFYSIEFTLTGVKPHSSYLPSPPQSVYIGLGNPFRDVKLENHIDYDPYDSERRGKYIRLSYTLTEMGYVRIAIVSPAVGGLPESVVHWVVGDDTKFEIQDIGKHIFEWDGVWTTGTKFVVPCRYDSSLLNQSGGFQCLHPALDISDIVGQVYPSSGYESGSKYSNGIWQFTGDTSSFVPHLYDGMEIDFYDGDSNYVGQGQIVELYQSSGNWYAVVKMAGGITDIPDGAVKCQIFANRQRYYEPPCLGGGRVGVIAGVDPADAFNCPAYTQSYGGYLAGNTLEIRFEFYPLNSSGVFSFLGSDFGIDRITLKPSTPIEAQINVISNYEPISDGDVRERSFYLTRPDLDMTIQIEGSGRIAVPRVSAHYLRALAIGHNKGDLRYIDDSDYGKLFSLSLVSADENSASLDSLISSALEYGKTIQAMIGREILNSAGTMFLLPTIGEFDDWADIQGKIESLGGGMTTDYYYYRIRPVYGIYDEDDPPLSFAHTKLYALVKRSAILLLNVVDMSGRLIRLENDNSALYTHYLSIPPAIGIRFSYTDAQTSDNDGQSYPLEVLREGIPSINYGISRDDKWLEVGLWQVIGYAGLTGVRRGGDPDNYPYEEGHIYVYPTWSETWGIGRLVGLRSDKILIPNYSFESDLSIGWSYSAGWGRSSAWAVEGSYSASINLNAPADSTDSGSLNSSTYIPVPQLKEAGTWLLAVAVNGAIDDSEAGNSNSHGDIILKLSLYDGTTLIKRVVARASAFGRSAGYGTQRVFYYFNDNLNVDGSGRVGYGKILYNKEPITVSTWLTSESPLSDPRIIITITARAVDDFGATFYVDAVRALVGRLR
ncbi:MAG: hypothetical protein J7J33_02305 [Caldisericia bacterium]|nr:hypothetical protein [Caldisericia bacterium]